jgi:hypothetical protein
MHVRKVIPLAAALATAVACATASATMMHPALGAKLAGMGEKGVVNLQSDETKSQLCWTFTLQAMGLTGASIRDSAGMSVASLGSSYSSKGCAMVSKMVLQELETKPANFSVWVNSKGHPGDLRGTLFAGMADTTHM